MIAIGILSIIASMEIYGIVDTLKETEEVPIKTAVVEKVETPKITEEKVEKPKKVIHFTEDTNWQKYYSRKGNRDTRYEFEKQLPVFKPMYTNWEGKTFIPREKLVAVTTAVIKRMPHIKNVDEAINLVVETCVAESHGGYFISHEGGDYGVFQIRINTAKSLLTWLKDNHEDIYNEVQKFEDKKLSLEDNLEKNIPYGVALCISEYWRKAGPDFYKYIKDTENRGMVWKSLYNTKYGKGTVKKFVDKNNNYIKVVMKYNKKNNNNNSDKNNKKNG